MMPRDRFIRFNLVALPSWTLAWAGAATAIGVTYAWQAGRSAAERDPTFRAQALAVDIVRELAVPKAALLALATSPGRGTGLGLSQLLSFVRLTGGVLRIDSEPGHRTTMRLYLPRHEDMQPAVNLPAPAC